MKIAVVLPVPLEPFHCHKETGQIVEGLIAAGHDAVLVTPSSAAAPVFPVRLADDAQIASASFWRELRLDAAVVFTYMTAFHPILRAVRDAGIFCIQKGDTDGRVSVRVDPWATFRRMTAAQRDTRAIVAAGRFWVRKYAGGWRRDDRDTLENLETAVATIVETEGARHNVGRFLQYHGRVDLLDRVHVIPNPVGDIFVTGPVPVKARAIVAIGRWDDPQKDGRLLGRALREFLSHDAHASALVMGGGGERFFQAPPVPRLTYTGAVPHEDVIRRYAPARIMVFSSRWEGMPLALSEALSLGSSIVSTDIPTIASLVAPSFGTLALGRRPADLVFALQTEMRAWDEGRRNADAIAAHWRPRLSKLTVARQILALVG